MVIDSFTLKQRGREYHVVKTTMHRCPHPVYSVFYKGQKILGQLDRPTADDCALALANRRSDTLSPKARQVVIGKSR